MASSTCYLVNGVLVSEILIFVLNHLLIMKRLYNRVDKEILKKKIAESDKPRTTLSFYRYAKILHPQEWRDQLFEDLSKLEVLGRIYVANEGINAQISLPTDKMNALRSYIESYSFLQNLRLNIAIEDDPTSFFKLVLKVRHKIVADGLEDEQFDVTNKGTHVDAEKFNELTDKAETVVVDMRNHYESEVGHFDKAICPDVETFRESLPIVANMLNDKKNTPIIMYCTGGIRCEKASAYLKHNGFNNVFQLEGGIIEYARQVEKKGLENKFKGKNFVFDERLGERITEEIVSRCHQCGDACDKHLNCANDACHLLFIQCEKCAAKYKACCSEKCVDFIQLTLEEQKIKRKTELFNGTKFGKGRYKANRASNPLVQPSEANQK